MNRSVQFEANYFTKYNILRRSIFILAFHVVSSVGFYWVNRNFMHETFYKRVMSTFVRVSLVEKVYRIFFTEMPIILMPNIKKILYHCI